jgi:hypothetical protein
MGSSSAFVLDTRNAVGLALSVLVAMISGPGQRELNLSVPSAGCSAANLASSRRLGGPEERLTALLMIS